MGLVDWGNSDAFLNYSYIAVSHGLAYLLMGARGRLTTKALLSQSSLLCWGQVCVEFHLGLPGLIRTGRINDPKKWCPPPSCRKHQASHTPKRLPLVGGH